MKYQIYRDEILIEDTQDFNIKDICHCGQLFRYFESANASKIISKNEIAVVIPQKNNEIKIEVSNAKYFENYFDLNTDYFKIKNTLKKNEILNDAINFGGGIRILKQDFFETFFSFIVSQNNNIKRIQNSLNLICEHFGEKIEGDFAFPTPQNLREVGEEDYAKFGVGYRAKYLEKFICEYNENLENELKNESTLKAREKLISFLGVGEKVADCILLFGLGRMDVFPCDTWIDKVAREYFGLQYKSRSAMSKCLVEKFQDLSGYAQQYLFYYKRELERKK